MAYLNTYFNINTIKAIILAIVLCTQSFNLLAQDELNIHNGGHFQVHSGTQWCVFGSLVNNSYEVSNEGTVHIAGNNLQLISGDSSLQFDTLILNNPNNLSLLNELRVSGYLIFQNGRILTQRNDSDIAFIHLLDNVSYSGSSDSNFVDGTLRKTGNDAFTFPIGQNNNLQALAISAPSQITDQFTAFYRQTDASNYGYSTSSIDSNCGGSAVVVDISEAEYWNLEQTAGSSNVQLSLYYDQNSSVNTPAELMVVRWNGTKWQSEGNGGITGTAGNGTITTGSGCGSTGSASAISNFGAFTLSASTLTALPVEYLYFTANKWDEQTAVLEWATATEINSSHFEIERSSNGIDFNQIGIARANGNSNQIKHYQFFDNQPYKGINYYRLKQVDFNEDMEYSPIRTLEFDLEATTISVYPNPTENWLNIDISNHTQNGLSRQFYLYDAYGKLILQKELDAFEHHFSINISEISAGVYTLQLENKSVKIIKY